MGASRRTAWLAGVGLVAVVLGTAACGEASSPTTRSVRPDPRTLLLRLSDLGEGYRIGDDSGCGAGAEGAPPTVAGLVRSHRPTACFTEFEQVRAAPPAGAAPLVHSAAYVFSGEEGARAAFRGREELAAYAIGLEPGVLRAGGGAPATGDEASVLTTRDALVRGRSGRPGVAVVWRQGAVLGLVFVGGLSARSANRAAVALAERQEARTERPAPVPPGEDDDRAVALDDPRLGIDVHWLGRRFDPGGGLPPLALERAEGPIAPGGGPGNVVKIDYRAERAAIPGVTLDLWEPEAWARFRRTGLGRLVWGSRCAERRALRLPRGRADIYAGYAAEEGPPCPRRPFDRFLAHVHFDGVVVAVNVPYCFACASRGSAAGGDPYDSSEGMEAIARGLRPRRAGE